VADRKAGSAKAFVEAAASGDRYEVEAARIALRRSRSEGVQAFAQMMIDHHTSASHQLMSALRTGEVTRSEKGLEMPTTLQARHSGLLDELNKVPDEEFDASYLEQQKQAHGETAALLSGYAAKGGNPQLCSVARSALPMVQRHAAMVERIGRH
jgi:putative membrane protein